MKIFVIGLATSLLILGCSKPVEYKEMERLAINDIVSHLKNVREETYRWGAFTKIDLTKKKERTVTAIDGVSTIHTIVYLAKFETEQQGNGCAIWYLDFLERGGDDVLGKTRIIGKHSAFDTPNSEKRCEHNLVNQIVTIFSWMAEDIGTENKVRNSTYSTSLQLLDYTEEDKKYTQRWKLEQN